MSYKATWERFEYLNENKTKAFENLCRLLFKRTFFDKKTIFQSIPNTPGIEVLPIYCNELNKRISFQSKYFSSERNKYAEIKKSMEETITHYKGEIDTVYLYSNKELDLSCNQYKKIETLLRDNGIELISVVNDEILNKVIEYPELLQAYFNTGRLTIEWFNEKFAETKDIIGPRYTPEFNVETEAEKFLNLFLLNDKAIKASRDRQNSSNSFKCRTAIRE